MNLSLSVLISFPTALFYTTVTHKRKNNSSSHAIRANYNVAIDTLQNLSINPSISYSDNASESINSSKSTTVSGDLINTQNNTNRNIDKSYSFNNQSVTRVQVQIEEQT